MFQVLDRAAASERISALGAPVAAEEFCQILEKEFCKRVAKELRGAWPVAGSFIYLVAPSVRPQILKAQYKNNRCIYIYLYK